MPRIILNREYLTPAEAAERIGCAASSLKKYRTDGNGPAFIRLFGSAFGRVLYDAEAVDEWLAAQIEAAKNAQTIAAERRRRKVEDEKAAERA